MSEGLVTRIGRWLDTKFSSKATESQLMAFDGRLTNLEVGIRHLEITDLKKRLEQLELYVGMKRVADPTKSPVAKSAFAM